jgi:hypothetical protein
LAAAIFMLICDYDEAEELSANDGRHGLDILLPIDEPIYAQRAALNESSEKSATISDLLSLTPLNKKNKN